jgi:integrase
LADSDRFCVYAHRLRSTGQVFYVGKGTRLRAHTATGRTTAWHRKVMDDGFSVDILARELSEHEALQVERLCIERIGLRNLVNQTEPCVAIDPALQHEYAHLLRGDVPPTRRSRMSVSVQQRSKRFQLRVKHKLLRKPFFFTFEDEGEARSYGAQLHDMLQRGIVPAELAEMPATRNDPALITIVRAYVKGAPHLTASDEDLLGSMLPEVASVPLSALTYAWVERYVAELKREANLAPGTIRKRIGALARVIDWHLRSTASTAGNPLRLLPRGYSQYTSADRAALPAQARPKRDVQRDRRLTAKEEAAIRPHLGDLTLMFDLIVNTGLRLREAYRLRTDQVDLDKGILRVEGTKGTRGMLKPRTVPLVPHLRKLLARHCRGRVGLLFNYWNGEASQLDAVTARLSYLFGKAFAAGGVKDLTEHDLRHEATCRWFEHRTGKGWTFSEIEICRILGWTSTRMVLRYASLRGEDLAARLK